MPQTCKNFINDSLANWNVHDIIVFTAAYKTNDDGQKIVNLWLRIVFVMYWTGIYEGGVECVYPIISHCHQVVVLSRVGQNKISGTEE